MTQKRTTHTYQGGACYKCGGTARYSATRGCVECTKASERARAVRRRLAREATILSTALAPTPSQINAALRLWRRPDSIANHLKGLKNETYLNNHQRMASLRYA